MISSESWNYYFFFLTSLEHKSNDHNIGTSTLPGTTFKVIKGVFGVDYLTIYIFLCVNGFGKLFENAAVDFGIIVMSIST